MEVAKAQQAEAEGCIPFTIDGNIQYPARYYKKKWIEVAKNYKRLLKKKIALERALQQTIASQIQRKISKYHVLAGLEIEVGSVPAFLWSKMMRGWISYVPKRKKSHFQEYKKTQLSRKFFKSFPMVRRDKTVAPDLVMRITVSAQAVARAMYDFQGERMILTFWYEPFPFPQGWYPTYKCCTNSCKTKPKKSYWVEK